MYDMTELAEKKEKMISTRVTEENISSMDKMARSQGITRSQWVRRAILAQLTFDLIELKRESEPPIDDVVAEAAIEDAAITDKYETVVRIPDPAWEPGDPNPYLEDLAPSHEEEDNIVDLALSTAHHVDCIKSIDHEGACLD